MKKKVMLVTMALIIVAISVFLPFAPLAKEEETVINNAYQEYSSTNNPNGVWSYESRKYDTVAKQYQYTALTYADGVWGSVDTGTAITTTTNCMETHTTALHVLASADLITETVLTYTAPESGTVQIYMTNGGVFSTTRNSSGLIRFSVLKNEIELKSVSDLGNTYTKTSPFFGSALSTVVKKGDVIRFVVGKNEDKGGKTYTDFAPEIKYAKIEKPKPKEYSAADEFTGDKMEDQWRYYGYNPSTLQFQKLESHTAYWGTSANCSIGVGVDPVLGMESVSLHTGLSLDPTLAFITPYTGKLKISMKNGGIFAADSGYDGVIFTLRLNDEIITTEKINSVNNYEGHRVFADTKEFSVTAGDIFYFSFNQNTNTRGDSINFDPHIEYIETIGEYDSTLRFLDEDEIICSNLYKDSFDITWPSARGGIGEYSYEVYTSTTPITGIPTTDGIKIENGRKYSFTKLSGGTAYYVGVVASDGVSKALLTNTQPVNTISDLFVFNAHENYKTVNMTSPWSYEVKPAGTNTYKKLEWNAAEGIWGDYLSNGYITSATQDLVTGSPAILLEPYAGSTLSLTYTAPYTGTVDVSIANGGIMVPYNGAGNAWDGINFHFTQNGNTLKSFKAVNAANCHPSSMGAMYKGRLFDDKMTLKVKAGDILRFAVDPNQSFGNDKTFINPEIIYTQVASGSLDLHFEDGKSITAENITSSQITAVIPTAFGGTGKNEYTLYYSSKPITAIPQSGGICLGEKTTYTLTGLSAYSNYYFAAKVFDGEHTASLIMTRPIATIGNTYVFDAMDDWYDGGQPINTPWRYTMQSIKDGVLTNLNWDSKNKTFIGNEKIPSISVSSDEYDPVTGGASLKMHPDNEYNFVISFTAPYTGNVTLEATNGGVFTPYNGAAQKFDGINFSIVYNGKTIYSKKAVSGSNNHNDRCFSNPISLSVKRGDLIYFVVNKNENVNADTTYFNPRITYTFVKKGSDIFAFWPDASITNENVTNNSFDLKWSSAMGPNGAAEKYSVWIGKSPMRSKPTTPPVYTGSKTACKCTGLLIGTRYYAYIEAVDKAGAKAVLNPKSYIMTLSPIYNAHADYNTENGAGIWNYAVRVKDPKTGEIGYKLLNCDDNGVYGNTSNGAITIAASDLVCGANVINMHPGSAGQAPVLVFTAPYSGEIQISMKNGGVFCPNNGAEQKFDGIAFDVLKNAKSIQRYDCVSSKNNPENDRLFTKPIAVTVKVGDKIYFVVEPNANNAGDSTYFSPEIEYLNITGGSGKVTSLSGFQAADVVEENQNNLTSVVFRQNNTKIADKATGYEVELDEEEDYTTEIIFYSSIGCAILAVVAFIISIILKKSKIKE